MNYTQKITPNPNVWCRPGWCLAYVKDSYGLEPVYPSATAAWNASTTKHRDHNFPPGLWVPLWFHMPDEPLGHVVLRAPDGTIYSTTTMANVAYRHPDIQDLHNVYARAGLPLVYLGWTEDVEGQTVIEQLTETDDEEMDLNTLEQIQGFSNENGDRVINMLRAEENARHNILVKLIGDALNIDETKLAAALLEQGEITVTKK